ncbi:MAG: FG-GAP-like repeat-containing protein [bacterium]
MKKSVTILTFITSFILFSFSLKAQDRFDRAAVIPAQPDDIGGFGNVVAGVDFDGDGLLEMYTVNNDWHDVLGKDLTPRIYKYEKNSNGAWQIVWWTRLPFDFQNTWPGFAAADLDKDGRQEIVWGPVNNFGGGLNPNPPRIVVFESAGDGSDIMGVDNGDGTFRPNAQFTITDTDNNNIRPFRWFINDIDSDGTDEIVASARVGDGVQIFSVDDIPDAADSSETWTIEFSGVSGVYYDLAIIGPTVYAIRSNGDVTSVTWDAAGDSFRVGATQLGIVGKGSWKSAAVVDVDKDGQEEIMVASWNSATSNVYLLQPDADTLKSTVIKDVPDASFRLYGGAAGDLDNDGNLDFVFGTRSATPNALIHRLEYQGGPIDDPNSYELTNIDHDISKAIQYDVIFTANMDDDPEDEVVYSGTPRGLSAAEPPQPLVILDMIDPNQPVINRIVDVPNDQGRQVRVDWLAAADDIQGTEGFVITEYTVWRKVGPAGANTNAPAAAGSGKIITINQAEFEQVGSTNAIQSSEYSLTVPTLVDKVEGSTEPALSTFVVFAHTADPLINWGSLPKSGFSVDNLIPTAPTSVLASETANGVQLTWDESPDEDFNYFAVVRGAAAGFDPATAEVLGTTTDTQFLDPDVAVGQTWYYRVVAFDFNKNQGEFSEEVSLQVTSVAGDRSSSVPTVFSLHQNFPNPFNPDTKISYDLPKAVNVSLKIYNIMGQEVMTLVDKAQAPGKYTVRWNGLNNAGNKVAGGMYVFVIKAGDFVQSKRMTLLK